MTPDVLIATITAVTTIVVAAVQAFTLYQVGKLQAHSQSNAAAITHIQADTKELATNTNSIKDQLVDLTRKEGIQTGREQVEKEMSSRKPSP